MKKSILDCNKISYTNKEATNTLKLIQAKPEYELKYRKESRVYQCPVCRTWHLTSITGEELKVIQDRAKKKKEVRIEREADYWKLKLGLEDNDDN